MFIIYLSLYNISVLLKQQNGCKSEWLVFSTNSWLFQLYYAWWEQVNFQWDDNEVCFVLDQHTLSWIFIVISHWNNSPRISMLPTLTHYPGCEPTSFCSFFLIHTNCIVLDWQRSTTTEASTLPVTPPIWLSNI